jgi:predicted MPP superfamily phosphohydrolase
MLLDSSVTVEERGKRVELAGVDPRTWVVERRASVFEEPAADLHILLCHFPRALDFVPEGRWDLILAGHLHAGQIVLPYGFGKLLLAHPGARYTDGVFERDGTVMHVSPGLGTTFVPFRFFARPEATELVLRSGN